MFWVFAFLFFFFFRSKQISTNGLVLTLLTKDWSRGLSSFSFAFSVGTLPPISENRGVDLAGCLSLGFQLVNPKKSCLWTDWPPAGQMDKWPSHRTVILVSAVVHLLSNFFHILLRDPAAFPDKKSFNFPIPSPCRFSQCRVVCRPYMKGPAWPYPKLELHPVQKIALWRWLMKLRKTTLRVEGSKGGVLNIPRWSNTHCCLIQVLVNDL